MVFRAGIFSKIPKFWSLNNSYQSNLGIGLASLTAWFKPTRTAILTKLPSPIIQFKPVCYLSGIFSVQVDPNVHSYWRALSSYFMHSPFQILLEA